jgi:hypothetical protein
MERVFFQTIDFPRGDAVWPARKVLERLSFWSGAFNVAICHFFRPGLVQSSFLG